MPTVKNISDLSTDTASTLYENSFGLIRADIHQSLMLDILISSVNRVSDDLLLNLREYSSTGRAYKVGECCVLSEVIYQAVNITSGSFNSSDWQEIGAGSTLSGTENYLPFFDTSTTLNDSWLSQDSDVVFIAASKSISSANSPGGYYRGRIDLDHNSVGGWVFISNNNGVDGEGASLSMTDAATLLVNYSDAADMTMAAGVPSMSGGVFKGRIDLGITYDGVKISRSSGNELIKIEGTVVTIQSADIAGVINFNASAYNFASLTPNTYAYFDSTGNLTAGATPLLTTPGLSSVLGVSASTGNITIHSPNSKSALDINNVFSSLRYSDAGVNSGVGANSGSASMTYDDGVITGNAQVDISEAALNHSTQISLNAPAIILPQGVIVNSYTKLTLDGSQVRLDYDDSTVISYWTIGSAGLIGGFNDGAGNVGDIQVAPSRLQIIWKNSVMSGYSFLQMEQLQTYLQHPSKLVFNSPVIEIGVNDSSISSTGSGFYIGAGDAYDLSAATTYSRTHYQPGGIVIEAGISGGSFGALLMQIGQTILGQTDNLGSATYMFIRDTGSIIAYSDITGFAGIEYSGDISADYTTNSLVQFGYTDATYVKLAGGTMLGDLILSGDPTSPMMAATQNYVDNAIVGLQFKTAVDAASTANVNISSSPNFLDSVAGINGVSRWLLKDQTTASQNGIYLFNGVGNALTRTTDATAGTQLANKTVPVKSGTVNADTWWTITNDTITIGVTSIILSQTGGGGTYTNGSGITLTGNIFSVAAGAITNAMLAGSIVYSKLSLTSSITNGDLAGSITSSKLVGTDIATVGTIITGAWQATKISEGYGGTNQSGYLTGDMLYASASNTLSKLGIGLSSQMLIVNTGVPSWQSMSGDITIGSTGVTAIGSNKVLNAMINSVVWSKITSTPITLAGYGITDATSASLASGHILVGNVSNIATDVALTLNGSGGSFALSNAGVLTFPNSDASTRGLLLSADWNTFNGKQAALSGNGFVKISGTTISYDNSTYLTVASASSTYAPINNPTFTGAVTLAADAVSNLQAVTLQQLNNAILGTDYKQACKYVAITLLPTYVYNNGSSGVGATITGISVGAITFDGVTPSVGDRVLVPLETSGNAPYNGSYTVTTVGSGIAVYVLTRTTDFNQSVEITAGDAFFISGGNTKAASTYVYNGITAPTVGTTSLTFTQTQGAGVYSAGTGLSLAVNTFSLNLANANIWTGQQEFDTIAPIFNTMTSGSLLFAGTSGLLSQNNNNLYWNSASHILSVNTNADFSGTDSINIYKQIDSYTPDNSDNGFSISHSGGTGGSPTESPDGSYIGLFGFYPYNGSAWTEQASIRAYVNGSTATNRGTDMKFYTKQNAGALILALSLDRLQTATFSGAVNMAKGSDIASAATTNIGAAIGNYVNITGTTGITAFDTVQAGVVRVLQFNSALTISHNATSLILPGAGDLNTITGDVVTFTSLGSGNWICTGYSRNQNTITTGRLLANRNGYAMP